MELLELSNLPSLPEDPWKHGRGSWQGSRVLRGTVEYHRRYDRRGVGFG